MYRLYMCKMVTILWQWSVATEIEREFVKQMLMPEDDPDDITMYVTAHPTHDVNGRICMDWCEIEVHSDTLICTIYVTSNKENPDAPVVSYDWHGDAFGS